MSCKDNALKQVMRNGPKLVHGNGGNCRPSWAAVFGTDATNYRLKLAFFSKQATTARERMSCARTLHNYLDGDNSRAMFKRVLMLRYCTSIESTSRISLLCLFTCLNTSCGVAANCW